MIDIIRTWGRFYQPTFVQVCTFSLLLTFKGCPHLEKIQASCKASPAAGASFPLRLVAPRKVRREATIRHFQQPERIRCGETEMVWEEIPTSIKLAAALHHAEIFPWLVSIFPANLEKYLLQFSEVGILVRWDTSPNHANATLKDTERFPNQFQDIWANFTANVLRTLWLTISSHSMNQMHLFLLSNSHPSTKYLDVQQT